MRGLAAGFSGILGEPRMHLTRVRALPSFDVKTLQIPSYEFES